MALRHSPSSPSRDSGLPRSRKLTFWAGWDTRLPPRLTDPTPDIAAARARIRGQLEALLNRGAIDSAHADTLDSQVAELLAPAYQRLLEEYRYGIRWLREFDATGRSAQLDGHLAAKEAVNDAKSREEQADHVYEAHVGLKRPARDYLPTDDEQAETLAHNPELWEDALRGLPLGPDAPAPEPDTPLRPSLTVLDPAEGE